MTAEELLWWLKDREGFNPGSLDPQVQARLGTMEGQTKGVPIDVDQAAKLLTPRQMLQILASLKPFARLTLLTSKLSSSMLKQRNWMQPLWKVLGMILILFWSPRCSVNS